jgi:hypothetical protein
MATWIVHLRIAENLLSIIEGLDESWFAIGSIAPDSGLPDEKWEKFLPPVGVTHFQVPNRGLSAAADLDFYRQFLQDKPWPGSNSAQFSFLLGYFFHLIADNLWGARIGLVTKAKFEAEFAADPQFIWAVKKEWYGLDFIYVRDHPKALFWRTFLACAYSADFLNFLPPEAIQQRIDYIQEFYQRTDEDVQKAYARPYIYLTQRQADDFVAEATDISFRAFEKLIQNKFNIATQVSYLDLMT